MLSNGQSLRYALYSINGHVITLSLFMDIALQKCYCYSYYHYRYTLYYYSRDDDGGDDDDNYYS